MGVQDPIYIGDPLTHCKGAIEDVEAYVLSEANKTDLVGFTFYSPEFKDKRPGWVRFKPAGEIRMEDLWDLLAAVYQSNSQGLDTGLNRSL